MLNGPLAEGQVAPKARVTQIFAFAGMERVPVDSAQAGDIVLVTGIDELAIGTTLAAMEAPEALPLIMVDEPTLSMYFQVNTSPLAGHEGKYVTSRNLRDRLAKEMLTNVALRVDDTGDTDSFLVSGRGELHLTILIENMRREGFELAVSRPVSCCATSAASMSEPFELAVRRCRGNAPGCGDGGDRSPARGSHQHGVGQPRPHPPRIPDSGARAHRLSGRIHQSRRAAPGLMSHVFDGYAPLKGEIPERRNGVLISAEDGEAVAYALWKLQERGRMFVSPGDKLYEGMVIGIHSRDNDLVVNPIKGKQLTNVRASGKTKRCA